MALRLSLSVVAWLAAVLISASAGAQTLTRPPRLIYQPDVPPADNAVETDRSVVLQLTVDELGDVVRVEVLEGSTPPLDHAAMGAACAFGFEPAEVHGRPVSVQVEYRYTFPAAAPVTPEPDPAEPLPAPARPTTPRVETAIPSRDDALTAAPPRFETVVRDPSRRGSRVNLAVGSINSVGERELRLLAPHSANDVLRTLPGVHVVDEEGIGLRPNIGLRGMDPRRSRKVLVLEDGAPVAVAPYTEPELYYAPTIERMRQVDVAKGADSILHGPQTVGGVLNYLSADPPRKFKVITEARLGNLGYWMGHLAVGNTHGPVGYRVDVIHRHFSGRRQLNVQLLDVTGKVRVEFTPQSAATFKVGLYNEDSNATDLGLTTAQYAQNPWQNHAFHDRTLLQRFAFQVNHDQTFLPWLHLHTVAYANQVQLNQTRQVYDRMDSGADYERIVPSSPPGDGGVYFRDANVQRNRRFMVLGVEPRVRVGSFSLGPTDHDVIVGVKAHVEALQDQRLEGSSATATSGALVGDARRNTLALAVYGQYRLTLFDSLHITPGVRVENIFQGRSTARIDDVMTFESTPATVIIPGVGVGYSVLDNLMFFAGVHRGYAPPRITDTQRLAPEQSWNLEAGSRYSAGQWLNAEAAIFHMDNQNQLFPSSVVGGPPLISGGRTRHTGVELSTSVDIAQLNGWGFNLPYSLSYTYVDARFASGPFAGNRVPYAPEHLLTARLMFIHPLGFDAQLGGTFTSAQFTDSENTKLATASGEQGVIGRRLVLDGRVAYTFKPLGVGVYISGKNLTDARYIASRAPAGIQPGMPRQVMLGFRGEL